MAPKRDRSTKIPDTPPVRYSADIIQKFITVLSEGWSVTRAARSINADRKTMYRWREEYPEFAVAWDQALEEGADRLEDAATERGADGIEEPIFNKEGDVVGHRVKYSDQLLINQLEARRPDKYRRNLKIEGGAGGGNVTNILIVANSTDSLEASRTYKALIQSNGSKE
jgi:hypothetical protein